MYTGAIFIEQSVGWDLYSSITTVIVITALYTLLGKYTIFDVPYILVPCFKRWKYNIM